MANNPNLAEAREKAWKSPNIGKRGKNKKTIEREELRAKFTEYFGEKFLTLLKQLEKAGKDGNMTAILEILRQLIGSADNKLDITTKGESIGKSIIDANEQLRKIYREDGTDSV